MAAAGTVKGPAPMLSVERAGAGTLGRMTAKHGILLRIQALAPLRVGQSEREVVALRLAWATAGEQSHAAAQRGYGDPNHGPSVDRHAACLGARN